MTSARPVCVRIAYDASEQAWSHEWKRALAEGIARHGDRAELVPAAAVTAAPADVTATWGLRGGRIGIMRRQTARGGRHLVIERGFVGDRFTWTALGFDGLAGRGDYPAIDDPSRFVGHHGHLMRAWRPPPAGRPVATIMGQVAGDAATAHVDLGAWSARTARALAAAGYQVQFRPHPMMRAKKRVSPPPGAIACPDEPLEATLIGTDLAVTFNSTAGVDAALAGVPVHAGDEGSPAWPVAGRDFTPRRPERGAWAARLAWAQWTIEEVRSGFAWEHLRPMVLERRR